MIRLKDEKPKRETVTKLLRATVTKVQRVTKVKMGRPKVHESDADRQRAYRARKKANG